MTRSPAQRRRAIAARVLPLLAALGALPLMAPTCGSPGEGYKIFSQRSLIIPMDVCYQYQTDGVRTSYSPAGGTTACPTKDPGDVIRAYGLVYQLIRNGIAVYWVIENGKGAVDAVDLTVQYAGGAPVLLYDWASGGQAGTPATSDSIHYRGGPFVVDGSDYTRASQVLQNFKGTFGSVNVHVSSVAFRGYAKRTMAGGWSAGGAIPPKLALLDIGSSGAGSKNSEVVIRGYLTRAGLDTAGASGTASGPHGEIFDRLLMPDFIPTVAGDWRTTSLYRNGYQILWVPHWAAPSSCSDCPPSTSCTCDDPYDPETITSALATIGAFVGAGGDVFAECAGLGSFEGVFAGASAGPPFNAIYDDGHPATTFQTATPPGLWIKTTTPPGAHLWPGNFDSPLMQLGDYPFLPRSGAISEYKAARYDAGVDPGGADSTVRLISEMTDRSYDIFTLRPRYGSRGAIVYLGGHSYSGTDGAFEIAGSRLVLNTLFNLGASCTASGVSCSTGLAGACSAGAYVCRDGQPVCVPNVQPGTRAETCNGLDDDCDWEVDEGLQLECYEPPPGYVDPDGRSPAAFSASRNFGVCRPGISVCQNVNGAYQMSACSGQVLPAAESCNGQDDDCDATPDDGILEQACYDGPAYSVVNGVPRGECRAGTQTCQDGSWGANEGSGFVPGACGGDVLPRPEFCGEGSTTDTKDDDCDGQINNGCGCTVGARMACFTGPGLLDTGVCHAGEQECVSVGGSAMWGPCPTTTTAVNDLPPYQRVADPSPEPCLTTAAYVPSADLNCDGQTSLCPECTASSPTSCYGPDPDDVPTHAGVGQCDFGDRICSATGTWGACTGYVLPSAVEYCDGEDNDCDGTVDEGAICPAGFACLRDGSGDSMGVCVPARCGLEIPPPEGYDCAGDAVVPGTCGVTEDGDPQICGVGMICQYGACIDPCPVDPATGESLTCGGGTTCGGGACIAGGCYEAGCPAGEVCRGGACVPSACTGVLCPTGTFCRDGDCVQACTFVSCFAGQKCGIDGFCEADPCAGRTCGPGERCSGGACAPDPCLGKGCATGQVCEASTGEALCVDDPCADVACPAGVCVRGQCFPAGNLTGAGRVSDEQADPGGCGCGSGGGAALPALLALLAAPLLRRGARRPGRTRPPPGAGLAVVLLAALAASGCKETEDAFDPSLCAETCGEQRCVDLATDPSHCGGCDATCAEAQQCVDRECGPAAAVAPYIRSLTPSSGGKDDPSVTVDVAGERFQPAATVRISTPSGMRTFSCPATPGGACEWLSSGAVRVRVDLTGAPESAWKFRVVNPDRVISNAVSFPVVVPIPAIATVTPTAIPSGTSATLLVEGTGAAGTGFTSGSQCRVEGVAGGEMALAGALSGEDLECFLAAPGLASGSYPLSVMSEKGVRSNRATLTVTASDPVVFAVDPNATTSTAVSFSVTGARFDATSRVLFFNSATTPIGSAPPLATTYFDSTRLFVSGFTVPPAGNYTVAVRNGASAPYKYSNGVPFTVGATAPPSVTAFTPPTAYQGDPDVLLAFTGAGFPPASAVELQAPGATTFDPLVSTTSGCSTTCTAVTASTSFVGEPDGTWYARVRFGPAGSPTSAPWPLRVLSNQAILRGYFATPAPEQSGAVGSAKTRLTFQVANVRGPAFDEVRVRFWDPSNAASAILLEELVPYEPTGATTTLVVPTGLSLEGLLPGTYTFTVHNPNAQDSNALPFTVIPGLPSLARVCLAGTDCTREVHQGGAPVTVKLTGTNFARPDVNGNGSSVMVTADFMAGFPQPDPCVANTAVQWEPIPTSSVAVSSATEILLTFDTLAAYADPEYGTTYYVGVWNPGGTSGPQKSSCGVSPLTLPWFKILP